MLMGTVLSSVRWDSPLLLPLSSFGQILLTVEALGLAFSHFETSLLPRGMCEQVPHLLVVDLQHAEGHLELLS